ncbi:DNA repair protein RecO [Acidiferrobacter sp.]|uniref:DNA repair protein RecO n=1 Tax=Acidiferrobacter sp. TaxID=1872107 RepID=UPI00260EAF9C|nr:DNA repair protein RecO [Acidiferrobacter sp.]
MRTDGERGFVLHRYPYGETSLLLEVFTQGYGRVGIVARGARRSGKAFAGAHLRPFQPLLLGWSGRGELGTLNHVEVPETAIELQGDGVWCAFYVNELILRLLHRHEAHADLYSAYDEALRALTQACCREQALRIFEKRLLAGLGYGLALLRDARTGEPLQPDQTYRYLPDEGPVAADGQSQGLAIKGATLIALDREKAMDAERLREAKSLLRAALAPLLGDKPLHTRSLYRSMQQRA